MAEFILQVLIDLKTCFFINQHLIFRKELTKDKSSDYVLSWKSTKVFNSELKPLYTAFKHRMKLYKYRIEIKFDNDPLAVEQNNYLTKISNVYILCDFDAGPRNPSNNFKFKNCLFGATSIVRNSDKEKYLYSEYRITFDSSGWWGFIQDTARNIVMFASDNSSSSHSDNCENKE